MTPASIRTNNPGAQWFGPIAQAFGSTGTENLADGNNAAMFPDPQSGAAAQFALLKKAYAGKTLDEAIKKWSGGNSSPEYANFITSKTGIAPTAVLSHDLLSGPQGLALAKAQAHWEAGKPYPMSDEDWSAAQSKVYGGNGTAPLEQATAEDDAGIPGKATPTGYSPGANAPPSKLMQAGDNIGNSLQEAGAWLQSINNPGGAAGLLSSIQAKKTANKAQLVDMGADPLTGKKRFGLFDPNSNSFKPFGGAPGSGGGGVDASGIPGTTSNPGEMDSDQFYSSLNKVQSGQMTPEDFKKSLHPMVSEYAQALVDGTADPRMLGNRAAALRPFAISAAHALDPTFNENQIAARQTEAKSLATSNNPSTLGGALASLGKVSLHGQELIQASKDLSDLQWQGGSFTPLNYLKNHSEKMGGDTDFKAKLNALEVASDLYSREADRLTSGGHPTLGGQTALRGLFSSDMSHEERLAAVKKVLGMSQDATDQLVYNNNNAFGRIGTPKEKTVENFMSPATLKAWKDVQAATGATGSTAKPKLPPGVTSIEVIP